MENRQISLNVGGQVFYTSTAVLRTIPHSLLADLCDPSVSLERAMEFPDKGFRHGTPRKDLRVYDTSPSAPPLFLDDKTQVSPARAALKEKLNRAKFIYISCNSNIRQVRRKPGPATKTSVSSSSSSSASTSSSSPPSPPLSSSSTESPRPPKIDFPEASPTTSLSWATSISHPPPYPTAAIMPPTLALYYPVANALSTQEELLVCTEQSSAAGQKHEVSDQTHHRKSSRKDKTENGYIDKYPLLNVSPQHGVTIPDEPIRYIDPNQAHNGIQTIYENTGIPEPMSLGQDYNQLPIDKGSYKPNSCNGHGQLSFFHRPHSDQPHQQPSFYQEQKGGHQTQPQETSNGKPQTDDQTADPFSQDYTISGQLQYDPQYHHQHHYHAQQPLQQNQHFFKVYHQQPLIPFPFPPACQADIYVDRNPNLVPFILDAYRIGQLHLPSNICSLNVRAELDFWKLPEDLICECCWMNYHQGLKTMGVVNTICRAFYSLYDDPRARAALSWTGKIWLMLERPSYNWFSKVWCVIYFFCIVLSCVLFSLLTVEGFSKPKEEFKEHVEAFYSGNYTFRAIHMVTFSESVAGLEAMEMIMCVFFTVELVVRLITCPSKRTFFRDVHNIIDVFILSVQWLRTILDRIVTHDAENFTFAKSYVLVVFYCLLSFRVLRVFHLAKRLSTLRIMYLSTKESSKELFLLVVTLGAGVLLFGTALFLVEAMSLSETNQLVFNNIPSAMWWAVITLTTVGYGDYVPEHAGGYLVGSICAIAGLLLVAMPIAIVASNFSSFHDNMTSRDQSIRRGLLMAKIKHFRTESARRAGMAASKPKHRRPANVSGALKQEDCGMGGRKDDGEQGGGGGETKVGKEIELEGKYLSDIGSTSVDEDPSRDHEIQVHQKVTPSLPPVDVVDPIDILQGDMSKDKKDRSEVKKERENSATMPPNEKVTRRGKVKLMVVRPHQSTQV